MKKTEYKALGETLFEEKLENGLRIYVLKKPGFLRSHAIFATRYGGADRRFRLGDTWLDTPAGVAHFLEHKMFDMPDGSNVLAELSARGASPNAFTSDGVTAYHFTCTQGFEDNLRTLLTYVSTPYYTEESVRKEQGIIAQEIRMIENSPYHRGYTDCMRCLYAHHPIRESVGGTVESIAEITPETLYNCHKVFYNPSNMVLCCVGDLDPEKVAAMARAILPAEGGEIPGRDYGEPETAFPAESRRECVMPVAAPLFFIGAKLLPPAEGKERLRQQLLAELSLDCLLGESSRFYTDLYARGLLNRNFGREVDFAAETRTVLIVGESREPETVMGALSAAVAEVACKGLDEAYFDRCKKARYGSELSAFDQFSTVASAMFRGAFDGWNLLDEFAVLEELTNEDAAAFLCENLTPERLAMAVVRPN